MITFAISGAAIAAGCEIATTLAYCCMCSAGITAALFAIRSKKDKKK